MSVKKLSLLMQNYFASKTPREQKLLMIASGLAGFAFLWYSLLQPAHHYLQQSELAYIKATGAYHWLSSQQSLVTPQTMRHSVTFSGDLNSMIHILQAAAKTYQVDIQNASLVNNEGVHVVIENSKFSAILVWLEAMQTEHGIKVDDLSCSSLPEYIGNSQCTMYFK